MSNLLYDVFLRFIFLLTPNFLSPSPQRILFDLSWLSTLKNSLMLVILYDHLKKNQLLIVPVVFMFLFFFQLQSLQKRMHGAMLEYFKYRGLYNQSELGRMENESLSNTDKVVELQDEMNVALKKITEFLENQMDGQTARKIAWDAIKKQNQQKQAHSPLPVIPPIRQGSMVQV